MHGHDSFAESSTELVNLDIIDVYSLDITIDVFGLFAQSYGD
jgi:hypothetical protein